jgi:hypothetical protein
MNQIENLTQSEIPAALSSVARAARQVDLSDVPEGLRRVDIEGTVETGRGAVDGVAALLVGSLARALGRAPRPSRRRRFLVGSGLAIASVAFLWLWRQRRNDQAVVDPSSESQGRTSGRPDVWTVDPTSSDWPAALDQVSVPIETKAPAVLAGSA